MAEADAADSAEAAGAAGMWKQAAGAADVEAAVEVLAPAEVVAGKGKEAAGVELALAEVSHQHDEQNLLPSDGKL